MTGREKPLNFVVVVSDTLRRDHLGAYGNDWIRTPALDRLAARSVVFDNHLIGSFPTMPARADLLTGKLSLTFMSWGPLGTALPTLPQLLSDAGYLTMGIVDTPFYVRNGFGYDRGFQDFVWLRGQGDAKRMEERLDARSTWRHESDRWVARTVTAAEEWLERHHTDPFFLLVDVWDPHEPWNPPDYYTRLYAPDYDGRETNPCYDDWRDAGLTEDDVRLAHATYAGEVTMVDRWLGRLFEKLDVLGIADDTVLVFASDHGYYFGEHGYLGKSVWDPDLGTQSWSPLYREIVEVPLLVQMPGAAPRRTPALTTLVDIPATVLDLAGVEAPPDLAGRSLAPILRGETDEHRPLVVSGWPLEYQKGRITIAVDSWPRRIARDQPFTVTGRGLSLVVGGPDDDLELYDLAADPGEERNIAAERPEDTASLLEEALEHLLDIGTQE
ncbi:MAG: sulfatase-like hydrolase/transferase, partial [Actinomycetota bacterium]|nr:sulfatase-like hydrolase/transferase [Actinomycetota bacterium]